MPDPLVTVIIPTHDHAAMLPFSVLSVLEQAMADLRLVVIGDGVGDDTRDVMADVCAGDSRVTFLDRPKSVRHGEEIRDEVISGTGSAVIAYHGDDDLLLPWHLTDMLAELDGRDFVHPLPILVNSDGSLMHVPTDLTRPQCLQWHCGTEVTRNAISLTGVVHTRDSYRRLPHGWRPAPPGLPTDLYMWQQYFALPDLRAGTGARATTIKLPAAIRESTAADERSAEIAGWWQRSHVPGFRERWDDEVAAAVRRAAVDLQLADAEADDRIRRAGALWEADRAALTAELGSLQRQIHDLAAQRDQALRDLAVIGGSWSWRLSAPLRRGAALIRRER